MGEVGMREVGREPEKVEKERETFLYFFTVVAVFLFLFGGWFIIQGISEVTEGLKQSFWGVYAVAVGIAVIGLSTFDTFYEDRYGISAFGILVALFGAFYGIFGTEEFTDIQIGGLIVFMGVSVGGLLAYFERMGWEELRRHPLRRFIGLVVMLTIFLIIWALLSIQYYG